MKSSKYLIICSQFNEYVTESLAKGAKDQLITSHKVEESNIKTIWVPGVFEIPVIAAKAARSKSYDAIICLGAVIKGETPHFDFICSSSASSLSKISTETEIPVIFGVLTTNTVDEAINRAGLKLGNKGREAASTAHAMIDQLKNL